MIASSDTHKRTIFAWKIRTKKFWQVVRNLRANGQHVKTAFLKEKQQTNKTRRFSHETRRLLAKTFVAQYRSRQQAPNQPPMALFLNELASWLKTCRMPSKSKVWNQILFKVKFLSQTTNELCFDSWKKFKLFKINSQIHLIWLELICFLRTNKFLSKIVQSFKALYLHFSSAFIDL